MGTEKLSAKNKHTRDLHKRACILIEVATYAPTDEKRRRRLERGIEILSHLLEERPHDPEFYYLFGYAKYMLPNKTSNEWQQAIKSLSQCVEANPHHEFAKYYLGCALFDQKDFKESVSILSQIGSNSFTSIGQEWRDLKTFELIVCGRFWSKQLPEPGNAFASVVERYRAFSEPELRPVPTELCHCVNTAIKDRIIAGNEASSLANRITGIF